MLLRDISQLVGDYTGLSRKVLEYSLIMKRLVDAAKEPGFSEASWAPLAELVDLAAFERVGNFLEVMSWPAYVSFLTKWAKSSEWECSFKRITEKDNVVFLELQERSAIGGHRSVVNSATIYEFNDAGKLRHLDIYLQMKMPDPEMLKAYN
ncbi:MAG TPA: hypothetical protein VMB71_01410 [Acetobacteraceae bacterium]|nr:hypothetical protein [Acetobacteraceae bacterium]